MADSVDGAAHLVCELLSSLVLEWMWEGARRSWPPIVLKAWTAAGASNAQHYHEDTSRRQRAGIAVWTEHITTVASYAASTRTCSLLPHSLYVPLYSDFQLPSVILLIVLV